MKKLEMEKQQRYHNLFNEARNICLMIGTRKSVWSEEAKEVVGIIDSNVSHEEYIEEVEKLIGVTIPSYENRLGLEYVSECFVVLLPMGTVKGSMFSLAPIYKDDKDFLYHGYLPHGEVCINKDNDRAGYRDLRDHEFYECIYDYFINDEDPTTLLRYNKPEITGDYSNQKPVIVKIGF